MLKKNRVQIARESIQNPRAFLHHSGGFRGAQQTLPPPQKKMMYCVFFIPCFFFCIRMLINKAQIVRESIKTMRAGPGPRPKGTSRSRWFCAAGPSSPPPKKKIKIKILDLPRPSVFWSSPKSLFRVSTFLKMFLADVRSKTNNRSESPGEGKKNT